MLKLLANRFRNKRNLRLLLNHFDDNGDGKLDGREIAHGLQEQLLSIEALVEEEAAAGAWRCSLNKPASKE